jgi:hypothetical protein
VKEQNTCTHMTGNGAVQCKRDVKLPLCTSRRQMWEWGCNSSLSRKGEKSASRLSRFTRGEVVLVSNESEIGLAPRTGLDAFEQR